MRIKELVQVTLGIRTPALEGCSPSWTWKRSWSKGAPVTSRTAWSPASWFLGTAAPPSGRPISSNGCWRRLPTCTPSLTSKRLATLPVIFSSITAVWPAGCATATSAPWSRPRTTSTSTTGSSAATTTAASRASPWSARRCTSCYVTGPPRRGQHGVPRFNRFEIAGRASGGWFSVIV